MKIVIIGSKKIYSLSKFYEDHLGQFAEVFMVPVQDDYLEKLNGSIFNKVINRINSGILLKSINESLVEQVRSLAPDIVLVFKGLELFPGTLKKIKQLGVKLVNYNPDHPFMQNARGSINANIRESIQLYDLHISYNQAVCMQFEEECKIKSAWIPFGYELDDHLFDQISTEKEVHKICFLGNPDSIRTELVTNMATLGYDIDLYGNHWEKYVAGMNHVKCHSPVFGAEFWSVLRKYRLQLNAFRPHNEGSHNMRTFDIPGAGGIMLGPDSEEQRKFFEVGKEAFFYTSMEDAKKRAVTIMNMDDIAVMAIRKAARERSVYSRYAYSNRAKEMFHALNELIN